MESRGPPVTGSQVQGLREPTQAQFTHAQAPPVPRDGTIPTWFKGFISRKETEDLMKNKPVGCFLVRLSDKAIGYILSYRGEDRCRHFVIVQNGLGQLVISGDSVTHDSLAELIEYYKTSPIEPYGEKLSTSCCQDLDRPPTLPPKPGSSRGASTMSYDLNHPTEDLDRPPTLPPKPGSSRGASTMSYDLNHPTEILPRQPIPGAAMENSSSRSLDRKIPPFALLDHERSKAETRAQPLEREPPKVPTTSNPNLLCSSLGSGSICQIQPIPQEVEPTNRKVSGTGTIYSDLNLGTFRRLSLSSLHSSRGKLGHYRRASSDPQKPPSSGPTKRVTCQTYSLHDPRENSPQGPAQGLSVSSSQDQQQLNPLYQTAWEDSQQGPYAWGPSSREPHHCPVASHSEQDTYASVPSMPQPTCLVAENTYELIPDQNLRKSDRTSPVISSACELIQDQWLGNGPSSHTYETTNDLQPKHTDSCWGIKADEQWQGFPENKKK